MNYFMFFNHGEIEGLFLGGSWKYTDNKVLSYSEVIVLGPTEGKVLDTILENEDGITFRIDVGSDLSSLDESFDSSDDSNLESLFLGGSLGYTDGKLLGSDEGI